MTDEMAPGSGEPSRSGPRDAAVRDYFECACADPAHVVRVTRGSGLCASLVPNVMIEVQLDPAAGITQRVWRGLLYIFGIQRQHWHEAIIEGDELRRLGNMLMSEAARTQGDTQPKATPNTETE